MMVEQVEEVKTGFACGNADCPCCFGIFCVRDFQFPNRTSDLVPQPPAGELKTH